jgi:N-formylglutamate amidohydrolase
MNYVAPPVLSRTGPAKPNRPVIISVPHAGRFYPPEIRQNARVPMGVLQQLEDRYADALCVGAVAAGFSTITANIARAVIDLNRAEDEWDAMLVADAPLAPAQFTAAGIANRVRAGLGIVPRRLHPYGDLWRERLSFAELAGRIENIHRPWHNAIADMLIAAQSRFGSAILIDLHSMPKQGDDGPQFVIGDRHGSTASTALAERLIGAGARAGLRVSRNTPYAGAFGVSRHARPAHGIEAVQVEIDRSLYLDVAGQPDVQRINAIIDLITSLAEIAEAYLCEGFAAAAE